MRDQLTRGGFWCFTQSVSLQTRRDAILGSCLAYEPSQALQNGLETELEIGFLTSKTQFYATQALLFEKSEIAENGTSKIAFEARLARLITMAYKCLVRALRIRAIS